jgi:hypothetical protein
LCIKRTDVLEPVSPKVIGACNPQSDATSLDVLAQSFELALVSMGEGRGARQTTFDQVSIEEAIVGSIAVRVEVDVGERAAVVVL